MRLRRVISIFALALAAGNTITQAGTSTEQVREINYSNTGVTPPSGLGSGPIWILPMAVIGNDVDSSERAAVEAAIRLGASQSGKHWVFSAEETARNRKTPDKYNRDCFSERCLVGSALEFDSGWALASQYHRQGRSVEVNLVLLSTDSGKVRLSLHAEGKTPPDSLVPFAREAAATMISHQDRPGVAFSAAGWNKIAWLNPRDTADNRRPVAWVGSGLLLGAIGLAWAQGQLYQQDGNGISPQSEILDGTGSKSFLRGFFAAPTLGARYAAMGGSGIAHASDGLALILNPAGVAESNRNSVVAAKRTLPDGTPSLFLAYAGPLYEKLSQGLGVQFEGDGLENETTVAGALAFNLEGFGKAWEGVKIGAEVKLYLAEVGRTGTGEDRSTGHSVGAGLDLGMIAHLNEKITAALSVRDAASILRNKNSLTNRASSEVLPPEYRLGAAYRVAPDLLLLMDGQKGLYADQADHVRMGIEQVAFRILSLRCGMHQIFGHETVRKLTLGFGINTDGFGEAIQNSHVSLNYSYEFGINENEPLGAGQQFSLEMGF